MVWIWLAGAVVSWPFMLRAAARGDTMRWDNEDWVVFGFLFLFVAAAWPFSVPFWLAVRWVRRGFERDEASKRDRSRSRSA